MAYYAGNTNKEYKNYYANPSSVYSAAGNNVAQQTAKPNVNVADFTNRLSTAHGLADTTLHHKPIDLTYIPKTDNAPNTAAPAAGGSESYNPTAGYYNQMVALYERQLADERARQERVKQARINAANTTYNTSMANLNEATNSSLRQAYITHMQEQKALPQQMQAYGLSGGATETNLANMKNVYGTNRANIQAENLVQQRMIEQDRANAIASAEGDAANYEASAVRDYNNGLLDLYASALNKNMSMNSSGSETSNIRKNPWYDVAVGYLKDGGSTDDVITELRRQGVSDDIIDAIMYSWESTI